MYVVTPTIIAINNELNSRANRVPLLRGLEITSVSLDMGFLFLRLNPERATRQRSVNFEIDACFFLKKNGGNLRQARLGHRNIRFDTEDSQPSMAHVAVGHETTNLRVLDAVLRGKPSRGDR